MRCNFQRLARSPIHFRAKSRRSVHPGRDSGKIASAPCNNQKNYATRRNGVRVSPGERSREVHSYDKWNILSHGNYLRAIFRLHPFRSSSFFSLPFCAGFVVSTAQIHEHEIRRDSVFIDRGGGVSEKLKRHAQIRFICAATENNIPRSDISSITARRHNPRSDPLMHLDRLE